MLTALAAIILLVHTQPIERIASVALMRELSRSDLWQLRLQLTGDASAALFVLFATTTLSVGLLSRFESRGSTFGQIPTSADPRIMQFALKYQF